MPTNLELARVLRSESARRIAFACAPTTVAGYEPVAAALATDRIRVRRMTAAQAVLGSACYSPRRSTNFGTAPDHFYFREDLDIETTAGRALVVHEATHALQDFAGVRMTVSEAEAAAYLAQVIYFSHEGESFRAHSAQARVDAGRPPMPPPILGFLSELERVAGQVAAGTPVLSREDLARLRAGVGAIPLYTDHVDEPRRFDGIRRRAR